MMINGIQHMRKIPHMRTLRTRPLIQRQLLRTAIRGSGIDDDSRSSKLNPFVELVDFVAVAHHADGREDLYGSFGHDDVWVWFE